MTPFPALNCRRTVYAFAPFGLPAGIEVELTAKTPDGLTRTRRIPVTPANADSCFGMRPNAQPAWFNFGGPATEQDPEAPTYPLTK